MSQIPFPAALEERIASTFEQLGDLTDTEKAEIRAHQTALAESLVTDVDSVVREHLEGIEEQDAVIQEKLRTATDELKVLMDKLPVSQDERGQMMKWAQQIAGASQSTKLMATAIESGLRDYAHLLTHGTPRPGGKN
jgi:hypothetical protein